MREGLLKLNKPPPAGAIRYGTTLTTGDGLGLPGSAVNGTWKLRARDTAAGGIGTVRRASLVLHEPACAPGGGSSLATSLRMSPPAGNGAELQLAFAPSQAPELAGLNLVLQIPGCLEQRGFKRAISGLGVQCRAMNPQCPLARMAGGLGVQARARDLQPHPDAEGRFGCLLMFEDHFGGGDRRQAMQVLELFLHLAVPGGLGVESQIAKGGFHIRSGVDSSLRLPPACAGKSRFGHV